MPTQDSRDDSRTATEGFGNRYGRFTSGVANRRERFAAWRAQRPFMGGVLLCVAGLIITWVPMQILPDIFLIGGEVAGLLTVGVMFGVFVFLTGVLALLKPEHADVIGVVGVVLSILSLFGSLGGLFLGMLFGILGGNLCIAWKPDDEATGAAVSEPDTVDGVIAQMRERVGSIVGKVTGQLRNQVDRTGGSSIDE